MAVKQWSLACTEMNVEILAVVPCGEGCLGDLVEFPAVAIADGDVLEPFRHSEGYGDFFFHCRRLHEVLVQECHGDSDKSHDNEYGCNHTVYDSERADVDPFAEFADEGSDFPKVFKNTEFKLRN